MVSLLLWQRKASAFGISRILQVGEAETWKARKAYNSREAKEFRFIIIGIGSLSLLFGLFSACVVTL
ncbi:hypothetical protein SLEP1_g49831 [Rubroshorea leprosula]|uniref:DUF3899 domain-containing protein n=1 Tax=Rubroshorea leprosula TaxID=152421 RepID=A0AAV5LY18_9ROSI|nr:hypothetical protein SLEP1_g49831 [Rubroshorea leprosula]